MSTGRIPNIYIIAGPNGAGKTTFAHNFLLPSVGCREFVNADLIAAGLSPYNPEAQALKAGRLQLTRLRELAEAREDFSFETTLSGRGYFQTIRDWRDSGYRVALFYLWLPSATMAVERVAGRVRQGGHNIPEETIRRRYEAGLRNFFQLYTPAVDSWHLCDGSQEPPSLVAQASEGVVEEVQPELYQQILTQARS